MLPAAAGIGLKAQHYQSFFEDVDPPAFIEVHAENYMGAGGAPLHWLDKVRERTPISLHGVGLSLGGEDALDERHIARLGELIERFQPASFSEHLAWSSHGLNYFNDLLPVAYDSTTLQRVCDHIDHLQESLRWRMLLENPATYLEFEASSLDETQFISDIVRRTGCGLLLDVNNVYVSCINHGRDPIGYLSALPLSAVGEIHLAGHAVDSDGNGDPLLIDSHSAPVSKAVWDLYAAMLDRLGPVATLIEWDNELPDYQTLRGEAKRADIHLDKARLALAQHAGAGQP